MPDFHSIKRKDLADYPLHIWLNTDKDSEKRQVITKLPKSSCIPRIGETIAIPVFGKTNKMIAVRRVIVCDVIYGLVNEIIHIICDPVSLERCEQPTITVVPETLEEFEAGDKLMGFLETNVEEELEQMKRAIFAAPVDSELEKLRKQLDKL